MITHVPGPGRRGSIRPEEPVREVTELRNAADHPTMSALTDHPAHAVHPPTADAPEYGTIGLRKTPISKVAYWRDGDLHVFQSTEYDVIAADENIDAAARIFVEKSEDYADFLADPDGDPAIEDLRLALLIYSRLVDGYHQPAPLAQLRIVRRLRGRGHNAARGWYHRSSVLT